MNTAITSDDGTPQEEEPLLPILGVVGIEKPEALSDFTDDEVNLQQVKPKNAYEAWKVEPSQKNLAGVVNSLNPTIGSVLATMQATGDPVIATKARVMTAKAVQSYDPAYGTTLPTWVSQQLRQLTREKRKSQNILNVPERVQMDAYALYKAEQEYYDENGREPTVEELSDAAHMSIQRIGDVRRKMRPVAADSGYDTEGGNLLEGSTSDFYKDALDAVYDDSGRQDKRLLEMLVGYGGSRVLDSAAIMQKTGMSPVQLTRSKARLAKRIQDLEQALSQ